MRRRRSSISISRRSAWAAEAFFHEAHLVLAEGSSRDRGLARPDRDGADARRPRGRGGRGQGGRARGLHHRARHRGEAASECRPASRLHRRHRPGRSGAGRVRCAERPHRDDGRVLPAGKLYSGQEDHARQGSDPRRRIERHARLGGRARNFRRSRGHHRSAGRRTARRLLRGLCRARRCGDRDQPHAEPPRCRFHPRHRSRSRGRGHRQAQGQADRAGEGRLSLSRRGEARFRARRREALPGFRAASRAGREMRSLARLHAKAAKSDRPSPDQRACRHHQLHDVRSRAAAARLRREEGRGRDHGAPRREG